MRPDGIHVDERSGASEGAPLVAFVHGSPDRGRSFAAVVAVLSDLDTLAYDRRGYGRSLEAAPPAADIADHVSDLFAVLDGRPATVIGHSFGGVVAMALAAEHPSLVVSLGLWEPPLPWLDWWPDWARRAVADIGAHPDPRQVGERAFKAVAGRRAWDGLTADQRETVRAEGAAFLTDTGSHATAPFAMTDVRVPCLIGFGTATWEHQVDGARRLADVLGAGLFALDGAAHHAHLTHPEGFADFVRRAVDLGREVPVEIVG